MRESFLLVERTEHKSMEKMGEIGSLQFTRGYSLKGLLGEEAVSRREEGEEMEKGLLPNCLRR